MQQQRRRRTARREETENEEDANGYYQGNAYYVGEESASMDARADAVAAAEREAERWARIIAQRDRQLRGAVLMQRSVRRYLNRTYERDASARTIQAFVRKYVLKKRRRTRSSAERTSEEWRASSFMMGRRLENATIRPSTSSSSPRPSSSSSTRSSRPSTPRARTMMVFEDGYAMGYAYREDGGVDDDEDEGESVFEEDEIVWGRSEHSDDGGERRGGGGAAAAGGAPYGNYFHDQGDVTRSTAPLTGSDVTEWADFHTSGGREGGADDSNGYFHTSHNGRYGSGEESYREVADGSGVFTHRQLEYEVFLWQDRQHALELEPCVVTGFPSVADATIANISLPGMWNVRDGDYLISINDFSTHRSEMAFPEVEQILESGVRPAILRFRRPRVEETQARERANSGGDRQRTDQRRGSTGGSTGGGGGGRMVGLGRAMSMSSVRSTSGGGYGGVSSSSRRDILKQRERTEASLCYVVWREEDDALGIRFKPEKGKPYPEVLAVREDGVAARTATLAPRVSVGDVLLSINDWGVRQANFQHVLQVLHYSPRPLVLTFRRMTPVVRTYEL